MGGELCTGLSVVGEGLERCWLAWPSPAKLAPLSSECFGLLDGRELGRNPKELRNAREIVA